MILSQTAVYAIQATLCLAESESTAPMRVDDIAEQLDMPRNYLSKILHALARGGVLTSTRGPGGGFRLAHTPAETLLSEIVEHFGELPDQSSCLLGRARCTDEDPCAAHDRWKDVAVAVRHFFAETSIADLSTERSGSGRRPGGSLDGM